MQRGYVAKVYRTTMRCDKTRINVTPLSWSYRHQEQNPGARFRCYSHADIHQNSNQQKLLIPQCGFQHEPFFMWIICVKRNSNVDGREKFVHTQAYIHIYMKSRHSSQQMQFITPNSGQSAFHTTNVFRDHIQIHKINNEVKCTTIHLGYLCGVVPVQSFSYCHTPKHQLSILSSS